MSVNFYSVDWLDPLSSAAWLGMLLMGKPSRLTHVAVSVPGEFHSAWHMTWEGVEAFNLKHTDDIAVWLAWKPAETVKVYLDYEQLTRFFDVAEFYSSSGLRLNLRSFIGVGLNKPHWVQTSCVHFVAELLGLNIPANTTPAELLEVLRAWGNSSNTQLVLSAAVPTT